MPETRHASPGNERHDDADVATWASAARAGDARAVERLVGWFTPRLFRFFARVLGAREPAADLTQETFLRMCRSLDRFDPSGRFSPWIFAIAWNLARDEIRRRQRMRARPRVDSLHDGEAMGRATLPADGHAAAPEERLDEAERREWIARALGLLPAEDRSLLVLREYEALPYAELAELFGVPVAALKSRLHRARDRLRRALHSAHPEWYREYAGAPPSDATGDRP